ncbi:MAG: DUF4476 domain-containing protein [Bacteroidetes bacterium]|nr:DUF4476 domain-containing protein [Bacteroidota bacterium]
MKKLIIVTLLTLMFAQVSAQLSNVILFTENGERFTAILNGVRQNNEPETNIKVTGLNAEFYKLKVIFESAANGEKNFNLAIELGNENTYVIKKNNKGEFVLRFMSSVPLAQAPASTPAQTVVAYHVNPVATPVETQTSQTISTTTTTTNGGTSDPNNMSMNMGVNVDGMGGSISINVSGMDEGMGSSTTTQSQTTTTTTTTVSGAHTPNHAPVPTHVPVVYLPGYSGKIGCPVPISSADFSDLKATISSKTFEETKFTIAKQVLNDRCMFVSQVKEIVMQFTFEQTRLDFAKYAYDRTYDVSNYFKVNDAFTFESSIEELNDYIDSRR